MIKKLTYRFIVIVVLILETFSFIKGYIEVPDTLLMSSVILLGIFFYPKAFFNKITLYYIIFILIIMLNLLAKVDFDYRWFLIIILFWTFILSILNVLNYSRDFKGFKIISIIGFLILLTTSLINLPLLIEDPMFTRDTIKSLTEGDLDIKYVNKLGIFSYGLVHAIPTVLPLIIYNIKSNKQIIRFLWLAFLLILCYVIFKLSFGTVIIISIFIIPTAFLISKNRSKNRFMLFVLAITVIFVLNNDNIISFLRILQPFFDDTIIQVKIDDIINSLKYSSEGSVNNRKILYEQSLISFNKNPIFGSNSYMDIGGHSFILDFLGWFGLLGTVPLILFFTEVLKTNYKMLPRKVHTYYLLSILPFIFISFLKGTPFYEQLLFLFIFIPGLFLKENKKIE